MKLIILQPLSPYFFVLGQGYHTHFKSLKTANLCPNTNKHRKHSLNSQPVQFSSFSKPSHLLPLCLKSSPSFFSSFPSFILFWKPKHNTTQHTHFLFISTGKTAAILFSARLPNSCNSCNGSGLHFTTGRPSSVVSYWIRNREHIVQNRQKALECPQLAETALLTYTLILFSTHTHLHTCQRSAAAEAAATADWPMLVCCCSWQQVHVAGHVGRRPGTGQSRPKGTGRQAECGHLTADTGTDHNHDQSISIQTLTTDHLTNLSIFASLSCAPFVFFSGAPLSVESPDPKLLIERVFKRWLLPAFHSIKLLLNYLFSLQSIGPKPFASTKRLLHLLTIFIVNLHSFNHVITINSTTTSQWRWSSSSPAVYSFPLHSWARPSA